MGTPSEPTILIEHREGLIYLLTEAAEIEHGLMCCYLYALYSLKRDEPGLSEEERAAIARWRLLIMSIAQEEMVHLALVSNLLSAVGSAPHLVRSNFPVTPGYHPAGVVVSLAPFDAATLDHFIYLERPEGVELPDGDGFEPMTYQRKSSSGRLVPSAQDYSTVGHLYRGIRAGLDALAQQLGEKALFVGDPRLQLGPETITLGGIQKIGNLAEAHQAIDTIVTQGEGASEAAGHRSHYARFLEVRSEYQALLAKNPRFAPARPAARNPVMRRPPEMGNRVWVSAEPAATWLDLANAGYALMLRCLGALFSPIALEADARGTTADLAIVAMQLMSPLAEALTRLPASSEHPGVHAGLTFTMSRSLQPPQDAHALRGIAEAARAVTRGIRGERELSSLESLCQRTDALADTLEALSTTSLSTEGVTQAPVRTAPALPPGLGSTKQPTPDGGSIEVANGTALTILFEARRCIHSRHCVLDAPQVFLANTPGEWIFPDRATPEALVGLAHNCPSGAIRYQRHDGGPEEAAPSVNTLRIRENGPLAIHAELEIPGRPVMLRATLCRCGHSKHKPFCDAAHVEAGFQATGEPSTVSTTALSARGGPLRITPQRDGPLAVQGNLEICAGTGRVVHRVEKTALCRCGGSKNKPFCDGTHKQNGFQAEGSG